MWNRCESCGKNIESAEDCRLSTNDGRTIHTYCLACFSQKKKLAG